MATIIGATGAAGLSRALGRALRGDRAKLSAAASTLAAPLCRAKGTLCVVQGQGTAELDAAARATVACAQNHLPKPIWAVVAARSGAKGEELAKTVSALDGVETVVLTEAEGGKHTERRNQGLDARGHEQPPPT